MTPRIAVPSDLNALLDAWEQLVDAGTSAEPRFVRAPDAREPMRVWVQHSWLRHLPFPRCWVVDGPGYLHAFIAGFPLEPLPVITLPPTARIGDLWVHPDQRRSGVGTALVQAFFEGARAAGYPTLEVGTLANDARATSFWRAQGFSDWQVTFRRDGKSQAR